ncbi:MAG: metallophosphoesterase family protein [Eubacterium sp.]|jgi:putative phosphoesterase
MKIFVVSDTHGRIGRVVDMCEIIKNIDLVIHCGDFKTDAENLEDVLRIPVVSVRGNCDGYFPEPSDEATVDTPQGRILVLHGHQRGIARDPEVLAEAALDRDCIAVCYGHTHVADITEENGVTLVNPGSISLPRDDTGGSAAIITADDEGFYANIVLYDTVCGDRGKKPKGGYLRGLINYSDGF